MVNSIILNAATRLLVALLLLFSVYMLLRGHNLPGGGFIGGLIGATGFVLYAIAQGAEATRIALRYEPQNIAMIGLGIALASGVYAVFSATRSSPANGGSSAPGDGRLRPDLLGPVFRHRRLPRGLRLDPDPCLALEEEV
jgi:multisubunit Na+/H+ antiporter MnhB subunit